MQDARQVYLFSLVNKPKDQVIKQLDTRTELAVRVFQIDCALFVGALTLSSGSKLLSSLLLKKYIG